jgi:RNA polymerase sigma factor (sigma-70 family)
MRIREHLEDHLGLVKSIVSKFDKNFADSDLYGIGCVALVEAHNTYDSEKGSFSTWATKIIKQSIFDNFRKNKKEKKCELLGEESANLVGDFKPSLPIEFLSILLQDDKSESKIDKENKKILIDHFINDQSWAEIGRKLNLTRERVRQKGSDAIEKIRSKYRLILDEYEAIYL